jgi:hypothetical protein
MLSLLRAGKTRDLESVVAHSQPSYSTKPTGNLRIASDNSGPSGPSFFERLFGGPNPQPAPPGPGRRRPQAAPQGYYSR